jgi:hypothetical protein
MLPPSGRSRPLTAADLGLPDVAVEHLGGSLSVRGQRLTVRLESIEISRPMRGRIPLARVVDRLSEVARLGGMSELVIEGVSVGNMRLSSVLVRRFRAVLTSQRTLVISLSLE